MTGKKQNNGKQVAVHTIRCGEVTASIYLRQSNAGFAYYDFSLGRCWKSMGTGKESHGSTFFVKNEQDLVQAIREASEWLREKMQAATPTDGANELHPDA